MTVSEEKHLYAVGSHSYVTLVDVRKKMCQPIPTKQRDRGLFQGNVGVCFKVTSFLGVEDNSPCLSLLLFLAAYLFSWSLSTPLPFPPILSVCHPIWAVSLNPCKTQIHEQFQLYRWRGPFEPYAFRPVHLKHTGCHTLQLKLVVKARGRVM